MEKTTGTELLVLILAIAMYVLWLGLAALSGTPTLVPRSDSEAQLWMAWAAWAQVAVGGVGLVGLGATVYFARNAWFEARETAAQAKRNADLAEEQLREADRGRLFVTVDQDTIEFVSDKVPVVNFTVQNVGARHVVLRVARMALVLDESRPRELPEWPNRFSSSASTVHPILLKAGEQREIDGTIYFSGRLFELTADDWPGVDATPYFFGSIIYTDHLDRFREYRFCFECYAPNDDWEGMIQFRWGRDESWVR